MCDWWHGIFCMGCSNPCNCVLSNTIDNSCCALLWRGRSGREIWSGRVWIATARRYSPECTLMWAMWWLLSTWSLVRLSRLCSRRWGGLGRTRKPQLQWAIAHCSQGCTTEFGWCSGTDWTCPMRFAVFSVYLSIKTLNLSLPGTVVSSVQRTEGVHL